MASRNRCIPKAWNSFGSRVRSILLAAVFLTLSGTPVATASSANCDSVLIPDLQIVDMPEEAALESRLEKGFLLLKQEFEAASTREWTPEQIQEIRTQDGLFALSQYDLIQFYKQKLNFAFVTFREALAVTRAKQAFHRLKEEFPESIEFEGELVRPWENEKQTIGLLFGLMSGEMILNPTGAQLAALIKIKDVWWTRGNRNVARMMSAYLPEYTNPQQLHSVMAGDFNLRQGDIICCGCACNSCPVQLYFTKTDQAIRKTGEGADVSAEATAVLAREPTLALYRLAAQFGEALIPKSGDPGAFNRRKRPLLPRVRKPLRVL